MVLRKISLTLCLGLGGTLLAPAWSAGKLGHKAVSPATTSSCKIESAEAPHSVGNNQYSGSWVHVGQVYHFGDLALRVDKFESGKGYLIDIKAPDYGKTSWTIPEGRGPATFTACNKDVSVAIIYVPGYGDAFVVGTF